MDWRTLFYLIPLMPLTSCSSHILHLVALHGQGRICACLGALQVMGMHTWTKIYSTRCSRSGSCSILPERCLAHGGHPCSTAHCKVPYQVRGVSFFHSKGQEGWWLCTLSNKAELWMQYSIVSRHDSNAQLFRKAHGIFCNADGVGNLRDHDSLLAKPFGVSFWPHGF